MMQYLVSESHSIVVTEVYHMYEDTLLAVGNPREDHSLFQSHLKDRLSASDRTLEFGLVDVIEHKTRGVAISHTEERHEL